MTRETSAGDALAHTVVRVAVAMLTAGLMALTAWVFSNGERVAALETTDKGLAQRIDDVKQDTRDIKEDVRDIHQYLLDGVRPGQR